MILSFMSRGLGWWGSRQGNNARQLQWRKLGLPDCTKQRGGEEKAIKHANPQIEVRLELDDANFLNRLIANVIVE